MTRARARIKLVPDADPNAEGEWKLCGDWDFYYEHGWARHCASLAPFVPKGFHIVKIEKDRGE